MDNTINETINAICKNPPMEFIIIKIEILLFSKNRFLSPNFGHENEKYRILIPFFGR